MVLIKSIRSTKPSLEALNPILLNNQIGYEEDTKRWKIGDGIKHYKELPYQAGESAYEIWLRHGNEGSEDDFLDSLKGLSAFEEACETGHWDPAKDGDVNEFYKTITNVWNPLIN